MNWVFDGGCEALRLRRFLSGKFGRGMAKTGLAAEGRGGDVGGARAAELKRELRRVVRRIVDEEEEEKEFGFDVIDHAKEILMALRELMVGGKRNTVSLRSLNCPEEFRCPISKEVMRDPVILATGQVKVIHVLAPRILVFV